MHELQFGGNFYEKKKLEVKESHNYVVGKYKKEGGRAGGGSKGIPSLSK